MIGKFKHWRSSTLVWLIALVLVLPVFIMVASSVNADSATFSHLWQTVLPYYIYNTVLLGLGVVLLAAIFGVIAAGFIALTDLPGRELLRWLLLLPLAMPAYLVAYLYTDLFDYAGPVQSTLRQWFEWQTPADYWFFDIRSLGGAAVVIALVLFPYVYMMTRSAFEQLDSHVLRASRSLGLTMLQSLRRVALPLSRPAIALALGLVLMETLADFATVQYFAVNTLTTAVYDTWLGYGDLPAANRIASLLLLAVVIIVFWEQHARRQLQLQSGRANLTRVTLALSAPAKYFGLFFCWALVIAGFLLPFILLLVMVWHYFDGEQLVNLLPNALNSFIIATAVAFITIILAVVLGLVLRLGQRQSIWPKRLAGLGYAVPGTVLAMAMLSTLGPLDGWINQLAKMLNLSAPGLIFSGSIFAIIFAYTVRFTAIANHSVEGGLAQISPSLDKVPMTLGVGRLTMVWQVHLPLLKRYLLVGWLLVFVEAMKELPAVLLLRPFNFDTLSTNVYQLISDERLEQGAIGAVLIVLCGLLPIVWLNKQKGLHE